MEVGINKEVIYRTKVSKVEHYGWVIKDSPGKLLWLSKSVLQVDHSYQRKPKRGRVLSIVANWSWLACGVITVARRADGSFFVVEGQHRVLAAQKRSDISELPCIVFESSGAVQEAGGFFDANANRKMPSSLEKWNSLLMRGDEDTVFCNRLILNAGRKVAASSGSSDFRCLSAILNAARSNRRVLLSAWPLVVEICDGRVFHERLFEGLMWLEGKMPDGQSLADKFWRERLLRVGFDRLLNGANRAAVFYTRGGAKVWGLGMLEEMNKGCRIPLRISEPEGEDQ